MIVPCQATEYGNMVLFFFVCDSLVAIFKSMYAIHEPYFSCVFHWHEGKYIFAPLPVRSDREWYE